MSKKYGLHLLGGYRIPCSLFIGIHPLYRPAAENTYNFIDHMILKIEVSIHNARKLCYGGAISMMGRKSGVATKSKVENSEI